MSRLNKTMQMGRVGKDPEIHNGEGFTSASFSLATDESYKDKNGNKVEAVEWHNILFYGKICQTIQKYVKVGDLLYVEGKLKTEKYEKNGETRYITKIIGEKMNMFPKANGNTQAAPQQATPTEQPPAPPQPNHGDEDDLPF